MRDALVIGNKALVGTHGIERAFQELTPGSFRMIRVDHPVIEGVLVRESDLRKMPQKQLIDRIVRHAAALMDPADALHVTLDVEVCIEERGIPLT